MNFLNFLVVTWVFSPFVFVASKHKVKTSKKRKKKKQHYTQFQPGPNETCAEAKPGLLNCPNPLSFIRSLDLAINFDEAQYTKQLHQNAEFFASSGKTITEEQNRMWCSLFINASDTKDTIVTPTNSKKSLDLVKTSDSITKTGKKAKNEKKEEKSFIFDTSQKHTYLIVLVPPYWGSTGLEGLLASSPHVSTMCQMGFWACEGTWLLTKRGVFTKQARWEPNITNWTWAYEEYHR